MRPLAAALCLGQNEIVLTGEPRMKERPIGHLVDSLRQGGGRILITWSRKTIRPCVCAAVFIGGDIEVDGSVSSQFLTALLMTAPLAPEDTIIRVKGELVSKPYIDITLNLMKTFGVEITNHHYQQFVVKGGQQYHSPGRYLVEGDASSASYFLAAGGDKRRHGKSDRNWPQKYAGRYSFCRCAGENGRRPLPGAMILLPARAANCTP
ncbi:3-phosphoshikimate 1-carboxyvinyltransferase [Salmonella enterica subsp. enterica]|nr:3-phosphoshikimate 1-carboxyvinyltransferase [Salmonella enterica subsp. enterica] [Salmonella enterica subsp. enterica serovar Menston]